MQPIAHLTLEVTAPHAVVLFQMPDDGLDRLAAFELPARFGAQAPHLAPMHEAHLGVVGIHPAVAQIDEGRLRLDARVLHQDRGLLDLLGKRMTIVGVAVEGAGTDDEVTLEGAGHATLTPNS